MQKTAVIVHLDGIDGVVPLVGGYLKAYARADPRLRRDWKIELYTQTCRVKASRVIRHLVERRPDLVAFSMYTWNAGMVARLVPALRDLLPRGTRYLLGGVEVMNVAPRYVDPAWEDVVVCNGEGERTFRELLLELGEERPDLERVGGITFARDGAWCTTPGQPRIQDLTELPSPWLGGALDDVPFGDVVLFETNRGCPFRCEFCFWGGAVGQKIYEQDVERLKQELDYIGRRGGRTITLCDANFGILPRDVEIAHHLVDVSRRHPSFGRVVFNSSKVRPERVEEISRIFADGGLMTRHTFSLQSMNQTALKLARRTSLGREPYSQIQRRLNERGNSSMIELLWPMPGETLDSFQDGVDDLCRLGAQSFVIYPLVWLNNTGYRENTEAYGVALLPEDDPAGSGQLVVKTNEVSFADYLQGLRFFLALYMLHDCRGLYASMQLLDALGIARFRDVMADFARWMDFSADGPVAELWNDCLDRFEDMAKHNFRGSVSNAILHAERKAFDRVLRAYLATRPDWTSGEHGALVRAALEYDLLCRPYVFVQTPFELGVELEEIELVESSRLEWHVRAPWDLPRLVHGLRTGRGLEREALAPREVRIHVDHRRAQLFLLPTRSADDHHWLCTMALQEVSRIEPRCTAEPAVTLAAPRAGASPSGSRTPRALGVEGR